MAIFSLYATTHLATMCINFPVLKNFHKHSSAFRRHTAQVHIMMRLAWDAVAAPAAPQHGTDKVGAETHLYFKFLCRNHFFVFPSHQANIQKNFVASNNCKINHTNNVSTQGRCNERLGWFIAEEASVLACTAGDVISGTKGTWPM